MKKINKQKGNVLILTTMLFLMISVSISVGLFVPIVTSYRNAQNDVKSKKSYAFSESGVEDVLYRLQNSMNVSSTETLVLGTEQATTYVSDINSGTKQIKSVGETGADYQRTVSATVTKSTGASFNYGIQVGAGGLTMSGGSYVNGNIYANGNISGTSGTYITGSAIAAPSAPLTADQSNGDTANITNSIVFGNATATQDIAQSFTVTTDNAFNKIQLYIKKTGTPSNATVYIATDNAGSPSTYYLATGTLSSSLVTTSYGWADATFSALPALTAGSTYWIVVDSGSSSTNYYTVAANVDGYSTGTAKIGKVTPATWGAVTPSTLDAYFRVYIGGNTASISGQGLYQQLRVGTSGTGTAWASNVNAVNATGTIYCTTGANNNKTCDTSKGNPTAQAWPISDANIADWKASATTTQTGNVNVGGSSTVSLGNKKIVGDVSVQGGGILKITGPLWITGNLDLEGGGVIKIDSSLGAGSTVIVVDGIITMGGGGNVQGSGASGSYLVIISLSTCPIGPSCGQNDAVTVTGGAGSIVLIAQNGTISFQGGAAAKEATGYAVDLQGGANVTYDSGLANLNFTSGPSGSWVVNSWQEVPQ